MLNRAYLRLFRGIPASDLPHNLVRKRPSTFRYCPFQPAIKPISWCEIGHFALQYGPFRMPKWCFSQSDKIPVKHKSLIFNNICKTLIIRVFAPEGKSARKYALIFRGISVNTDRKTEIRFQFESCPNRNISSEENDAYPSPQQPYSAFYQHPFNSRRPLSCPAPRAHKKSVPAEKHKKNSKEQADSPAPCCSQKSRA